jgi:hypothetical protein
MRHDRNPGPVDWSLWLRTRERDVRQPAKMFSRIGQTGGVVCLLCDERLAATARSEHHHVHMAELDAWLAGRATGDPAAPKPDSVRRAEDRRRRRQQELEQAQAFGRDPYLYAVVRVDKVAPNNPDDQRVRPVVRRRLRHPKDETIARVQALREQGRMVEAIADELHKSENYVRRLIRQIDATGGPK